MIDHVTMAVSDIAKSKQFYEQAFKPLDYEISFGDEGSFWAFDIGKGLFEIYQSKENKELTHFHIAFRVSSRDKVHEFYEAAIAAGGRDNGKPGPRPQYTENYYACFVYDPDGNNIEVVHDIWNDWQM